MVSKINQACIEILFDLLIDQDTGEVPWFLVHCYLCVLDKKLYSVCGENFREFSYCQQEKVFKVKMFKYLYNITHQYDELESRCLYNRGERFFSTLTGAQKCNQK